MAKTVAWVYVGLVLSAALGSYLLFGDLAYQAGDERRGPLIALGFLAYVGLVALGVPWSLMLPAVLPATTNPFVDFAVTLAGCAINAALFFGFARWLAAHDASTGAPGQA